MLYAILPKPEIGFRALELSRLAQTRISSNPMDLSVTPATPTAPATVAVADLMKSLAVIEVTQSTSGTFYLKEVSRHFATIWSSACTTVGEHQWLLGDMEGNLTMLRRDPTGPTNDDRRRLQVTGDFRLGEVVNKITSILNPIAPLSKKSKERARTLSSATPKTPEGRGAAAINKPQREGPLITPRAFIGTVEGGIYLHGTINPPYLDVLLRLQRPLADRVQAPGYMPWAAYRGAKTLVREADEPFRFVDGEVVEQALLGLDDETLELVLRDAGLWGEDSGFGVTVEELRAWGEELRRLY